ncbi:MAG: PAS domain-containing protein [Succinivibrio sp.]|nr:PAS domain-containing protein [Succinivibrio sp.]
MVNTNTIDEKVVLESVNNAILVTDLHLRFIYANAAAEQLLGMSCSRILTLKLSDIIDRSEKALRDNLSVPIRHSLRSFTANGVRLTIEPGHSFTGNIYIGLYNNPPQGLVVEIRSLARQQKIIEAVQRHSQHDAARDLIRSLAHEIKNPLGGIRGAAQLLEMSYGSQKGLKDYTTVIIEQSDRLKTLVDRLLGPQRPNPRVWANIHYVIEKVLALTAMQAEGQVSVVKDYDPSLPEMEMDVDAMQQALLNIISNALQAMAEGRTPAPRLGITTRAVIGSVIRERKYPTCLMVTIANNGPQIPEEIMAKIFYPMVTTRERGNGLGLSIAQNIIERHHGALECSSSPELTQFRITLPLLKQGQSLQGP